MKKKETIHTTLADIRTRSSITQQELADRAGVTRQTIIALEKGNYIPSVLLAIKIARVFRVRVEDIFNIQYI